MLKNSALAGGSVDQGGAAHHHTAVTVRLNYGTIPRLNFAMVLTGSRPPPSIICSDSGWGWTRKKELSSLILYYSGHFASLCCKIMALTGAPRKEWSHYGF